MVGQHIRIRNLVSLNFGVMRQGLSLSTYTGRLFQHQSRFPFGSVSSRYMSTAVPKSDAELSVTSFSSVDSDSVSISRMAEYYDVWMQLNAMPKESKRYIAEFVRRMAYDNPSDLPHVLQLLGGSLESTDPTLPKVGRRAVLNALEIRFKKSVAELEVMMLKQSIGLGELAFVLAQDEAVAAPPSTLTVPAFIAAIQDIAAISGVKSQQRQAFMFADLLKTGTPEELRFIVRHAVKIKTQLAAKRPTRNALMQCVGYALFTPPEMSLDFLEGADKKTPKAALERMEALQAKSATFEQFIETAIEQWLTMELTTEATPVASKATPKAKAAPVKKSRATKTTPTAPAVTLGEDGTPIEAPPAQPEHEFTLFSPDYAHLPVSVKTNMSVEKAVNKFFLVPMTLECAFSGQPLYIHYKKDEGVKLFCPPYHGEFCDPEITAHVEAALAANPACESVIMQCMMMPQELTSDNYRSIGQVFRNKIKKYVANPPKVLEPVPESNPPKFIETAAIAPLGDEVAIFITDCLFHNGQTVTQLPLEERRALYLAAIPEESDMLKFVPSVDVEWAADGHNEEEVKQLMEEGMVRAKESGAMGLTLRVLSNSTKVQQVGLR